MIRSACDPMPLPQPGRQVVRFVPPAPGRGHETSDPHPARRWARTRPDRRRQPQRTTGCARGGNAGGDQRNREGQQQPGRSRPRRRRRSCRSGARPRAECSASTRPSGSSTSSRTARSARPSTPDSVAQDADPERHVPRLPQEPALGVDDLPLVDAVLDVLQRRPGGALLERLRPPRLLRLQPRLRERPEQDEDWPGSTSGSTSATRSSSTAADTLRPRRRRRRACTSGTLTVPDFARVRPHFARLRRRAK